MNLETYCKNSKSPYQLIAMEMQLLMENLKDRLVQLLPILDKNTLKFKGRKEFIICENMCEGKSSKH